MTQHDIENAIHFLKRVVVTGNDVDLLVRTVEALEKELKSRVRHSVKRTVSG
jgi:hypothetical protein